MNQTVIFCDGACSGNPGPGGWGSILISQNEEVLELGGFEPQTTNNQMEILGATEALRKVPKGTIGISVFTDSVYVIRGITQWVWGWQRNGWKTSEGAEVQNQAFWIELHKQVTRLGQKNIQWKYARGHTGIPGNERCDEIAVSFSKQKSVFLYEGPLDNYSVSVFPLPEEEEIPQSKNFGSSKDKKAFSYLSYVNGELKRHSSWPDCEARVKGRPGARFKKAMSETEEVTIVKSWGLPAESLQKIK